MSGRLVHVVEYDEGLHQANVDGLSAAGRQIHAHVSGDAFLAHLDRQSGRRPPGCVLLDVRASGRAGLQLQQELQRRQVQWPVIVLIRAGAVGLAIQAMKDGAFDVFEHPCDPVKLLATVEDAFVLALNSTERDERIANAQDLIAGLTKREVDVLRALAAGMSNKRTANELDLSVRTVEVYRTHIMVKLHVRGLAGAIRLAVDSGLEPLDDRLEA